LKLLPDGAIERINDWSSTVLTRLCLTTANRCNATNLRTRLAEMRETIAEQAAKQLRRDRDTITRRLRRASYLGSDWLTFRWEGLPKLPRYCAMSTALQTRIGCSIVIGEYGAGKTFFGNLVRLIALERKCVTVHADLAPDRRIHASGDRHEPSIPSHPQPLNRNKPEGNALASVVERLVTDAVKDATERKVAVETVIDEKVARYRTSSAATISRPC